MTTSLRNVGARLLSYSFLRAPVLNSMSPTSISPARIYFAARAMSSSRRSPIEYDYIHEKRLPKPLPPPEDIFLLEKCENILQSEEFDVLKKKSVSDLPLSELPNPYAVPPTKCILCQHNVDLDYKNVRLLSQFVSPHSGQIYGRHITGLCVYMHRRITVLIKRSRFFGYMPYVMKQPEYLQDPRLYDAGRRKF